MSHPEGVTPTERKTLRATSSLVSFWAVAGLAAFFVGDAAFRGAWAFVGRWLPLIALVVFLFWLVLWRSCIRVERDRVVVINLLRVHEVPWARVLEVVQGPQVRLDLDDGSHLLCWGGPFPKRPGTRSAGEISGEIAFMESRRESAEPSKARIRSYWDVPVLALGVILVIVAVSAFTLMPS